ncbi:MAG: T9SS type A sorting domain-containing protein, partial [Candidatus Cloacimonetes bacterium]|nr:T9SS type A sorting domain-containing protein [Candidatus Cloacimonadota bacterium]
EYELGYNSRVWDGTYYTDTYCGTYFTPFSDSILLEYTINSVKTLLRNQGNDFATDIETIKIYDAIDDTTLGALLYTEDFSYTGGAFGTYEWAVFDLTIPQTLYNDFFVLISGDWWTNSYANYYPLFDNTIRQYMGYGAYCGHSIYFTDPGWALSSGDRFINTVGSGVQVAVEPGSRYTARNYLTQNYPNPFSTSTTISFFNTKNTKNTKNTEIKIYNIKGQLVKQLSIFNSQLNWEQSSIKWDGKDENGKSLSSGIYFYRLETDNYESEIKKMILIK